MISLLNSDAGSLDIRASPLDLFPIEIWSQIVIHLDIDTLATLRKTSIIFRKIALNPLLSLLVQTPCLSPLYHVTRAINPELPLRDVVLRMHKHIDEVIANKVGDEPPKWTDDVVEWEKYDSEKPYWVNSENFRKEVGRRGKARSRVYVKWECQVGNERKMLRREVAKVWTCQSKYFPFSKDENREWKKRREANGNSSRAPTKSKPNSKASQAKNAPESQWLFSHQIRNKSKLKRLNIGKGEEEFHRKILTRYETPQKYFETEDDESSDDTEVRSKKERQYGELNSTEKMVFALTRFYESHDKVLKFSPKLSSYQRKELHKQANVFGLRSKSFGEGEDRFLVIFRKDVKLCD
ncbi:7068_t:CDS:2 [Paraglomus brasilianum]|uniref:7068_t:CDS:1 n=1 Tax=Paraglomus brasilianum TaxID=144538 RepID=A0A9N8VIQ1_9GLOM|nr:7068_t:CDS:2 [Paraglomus brasilianum]